MRINSNQNITNKDGIKAANRVAIVLERCQNTKQKKITAYYDGFYRVYDIFSSKTYYHKARFQAVKELKLSKGNAVLNVPVGTGQNFEYLQSHLNNTGRTR